MDCGVKERNVNTRKLLAMLTALLVIGASAFAEIKLKDIGNGKVSITFLYKHPASEMGVIGTFDNWTVPGEAMTKNADGVWEYTLEALSTDEIQYKFYSKGTWIFDFDSPDKKDDGYGGNNGLIVVADILSGATAMKPGAAPVAAAAAPAPGAAAGPAPRQKVQFGTETYLDNTTVFNTEAGKFVENDINAKSIWKLNGDLVPNLPGSIEITAFNGTTKITEEFRDDPTLSGIGTMTTGFVFNPFFYLGGSKRPYLDKLAVGIDGSWLQWKTGYMNATLPEHKGILWTTVADDVKAGQGYSMFRLGEGLRELGPVSIDAAFLPNKSLDDYFAYLYWARASAFGVTAEFQYDMRSNEKTDSTLYFDKAMRQDYIAGLEAVYGNFVIRGQYLESRFAPGGAIDKTAASKRSAYKAAAGYEDAEGGNKALVSYAYRGDYAQLLYGKSDDVLGAAKTQKVAFDGSVKMTDALSAALEASAVMAASDNKDKNVAIAAKPSMTADLGNLGVIPAVAEVYAKPFFNTDPADGVDGSGVSAFGAKAAFEKFNVYYKFDNGTKNCMLNSLMADTTVIEGLTLQAAAGLRSGSAAKTNVAMALGVFKVLDIPQAKSPTVYAQFLYNMDPYNGTGNYALKLNEFGPDSGPAAMDGLGNLRFGINWNY